MATASTGLSAPAPGLKEVSSEPSGFNRAMRARLVPSTWVNTPPITLRPVKLVTTWLVWRAITFTVLFGPLPSRVKMVLFTEPSMFSIAMRLRGNPSTVVKSPPINQRPFRLWLDSVLVRNLTASTLSLAPTLLPNAVLTEPAGVPAGGSLS